MRVLRHINSLIVTLLINASLHAIAEKARAEDILKIVDADRLEACVSELAQAIESKKTRFRTRPAQSPQNAVLALTNYALTHASSQPEQMLEITGMFMDQVAMPILEGNENAAVTGMHQLGRERLRLLDQIMTESSYGCGTCGDELTNGEVLLQGYAMLHRAAANRLAAIVSKDARPPIILAAETSAGKVSKPEAEVPALHTESATNQLFLSDLNPIELHSSDGKPRVACGGQLGYWADGRNMIVVDKQRYEKALSTHPPLRGMIAVTYAVPAGCVAIRGIAALDDSADPENKGGTVVFKILAGRSGATLWTSRTPTGKAGTTFPFDVPLVGIENATLVVECPETNHSMHAVWLDPLFVHKPLPPALTSQQSDTPQAQVPPALISPESSANVPPAEKSSLGAAEAKDTGSAVLDQHGDAMRWEPLEGDPFIGQPIKQSYNSKIKEQEFLFSSADGNERVVPQSAMKAEDRERFGAWLRDRRAKEKARVEAEKAAEKARVEAENNARLYVLKGGGSVTKGKIDEFNASLLADSAHFIPTLTRGQHAAFNNALVNFKGVVAGTRAKNKDYLLQHIKRLYDSDASVTREIEWLVSSTPMATAVICCDDGRAVEWRDAWREAVELYTRRLLKK